MSNCFLSVWCVVTWRVGVGTRWPSNKDVFVHKGPCKMSKPLRYRLHGVTEEQKRRQEAGISLSGTSEVIRASSRGQMKALPGGSREIRVCGVWRLLQSPQARLRCWGRHQQVSPSSLCPWVAFKVLQVQKTAIGNGVHVTSDLKNKWAPCITTMEEVHDEDWCLAYSRVVL